MPLLARVRSHIFKSLRPTRRIGLLRPDSAPQWRQIMQLRAAAQSLTVLDHPLNRECSSFHPE